MVGKKGRTSTSMATPGQWYPIQGKQAGFRQCNKCLCDINLHTANCCLNCGSSLRSSPPHQGAPRSYAQAVGRGGGGQATNGGWHADKPEAASGPSKAGAPEKLAELPQLLKLLANLEEGDYKDRTQARIDELRKAKLEQQPTWKQETTVLELIEKKKKAIEVCKQRQVDSTNSILELQKVIDKAKEDEAVVKIQLAQLEVQAKQIAAAKLPAPKDYFPLLAKLDPEVVRKDGLQQLIEQHGALVLQISQTLEKMSAEQESKKDAEMGVPNLPVRQDGSQSQEPLASAKRPPPQVESELSRDVILEEAVQFLGEENLAQLSEDEARRRKEAFVEAFDRLNKKAKTG